MWRHAWEKLIQMQAVIYRIVVTCCRHATFCQIKMQSLGSLIFQLCITCSYRVRNANPATCLDYAYTLLSATAAGHLCVDAYFCGQGSLFLLVIEHEGHANPANCLWWFPFLELGPRTQYYGKETIYADDQDRLPLFGQINRFGIGQSKASLLRSGELQLNDFNWFLTRKAEEN